MNINDLKTAFNTVATSSYTTWKPKVSDVTGGELIGVKKAETAFGMREIIVLENDEGLVEVWMSKVLQNAFERLGIKTGDGVAIRFDGLKPIRGKSPMKKFSVWKLGDEFRTAA